MKYPLKLRYHQKIAAIIALMMIATLSHVALAANTIVDRIGISRGICVVLGDVELALELARETELMIYVQLPDAKDVESARRTVDEAGLYGTRVYVEGGALDNIHLADNLADAVVAPDGTTGIDEAEVLRVLNPNGKALLGQKELTKPFPEGVDDWSHPYHSPETTRNRKIKSSERHI